jgi:hypothetical protein
MRSKTIRNSSKARTLPATDSAPRPGDFLVGSQSRAAARMLLKQKERVEERKTNRPPDVRLVFDLPRDSMEEALRLLRVNRRNRGSKRLMCRRVSEHG